MNEAALYVGMDVHKATVAIAVAEPGRNGEVRIIGNVPNKSPALIALLRKLERKHGAIECAYEAGPCGYALYRELAGAGLACIVVAPSKIPTSPGHVKNDYRDALSLARLLRAGDLTAVWVPEPIHEAMRDLVRARHAASFDVKKARAAPTELPAGPRSPLRLQDVGHAPSRKAQPPALRASRAADRLSGLSQRYGGGRRAPPAARRGDRCTLAELVSCTCRHCAAGTAGRGTRHRRQHRRRDRRRLALRVTAQAHGVPRSYPWRALKRQRPSVRAASRSRATAFCARCCSKPLGPIASWPRSASR